MLRLILSTAACCCCSTCRRCSRPASCCSHCSTTRTCAPYGRCQRRQCPRGCRSTAQAKPAVAQTQSTAQHTSAQLIGAWGKLSTVNSATHAAACRLLLLQPPAMQGKQLSSCWRWTALLMLLLLLQHVRAEGSAWCYVTCRSAAGLLQRLWGPLSSSWGCQQVPICTTRLQVQEKLAAAADGSGGSFQEAAVAVLRLFWVSTLAE